MANFEIRFKESVAKELRQLPTRDIERILKRSVNVGNRHGNFWTPKCKRMSARKDPGTGDAELAMNQGIPFELVPGVLLSKQSQRYLYVRVVLPGEEDRVPPEKVQVKSYVPKTQFRDYYPARWPLKDYQEYFEVTRPIQAAT